MSVADARARVVSSAVLVDRPARAGVVSSAVLVDRRRRLEHPSEAQAA
jgi:hypothetical protein